MPVTRLLTPREAAAMLNGDLRMLTTWRTRGEGPKVTMAGGLERYRLDEVLTHIRNERRRTRQLAEKLAYLTEQARRAEGGKPSYMQPYSPRD